MEIINPASPLAKEWLDFIKKENALISSISLIDFSAPIPKIVDSEGRKFAIDFMNDRENYQKTKGGLRSEIISRAVGAGKLGKRIVDLSAGLGIDALFLEQLGYQVQAVERNPLIYLALQTAWKALPDARKNNIQFHFGSAQNFLKLSQGVDVFYFDPMFPDRKKSALPRQEMVLFKELVGSDEDASQVLRSAIDSKLAKRIAVKRPLKAPELLEKPLAVIKGKLIRFDIYGVQK